MAEITEILKELIAKTAGHQAGWTKSAKSNQFALPLQSGSVLLDRSSNGLLTLRILNPRGDTISRIDSDDEDVYPQLLNLWNHVTESYYQVNSTMDGILSELRGNEEVGRSDDDLPF